MAEAATIPQRNTGRRRVVALGMAGLLGACSTVVPRGPAERPAPPPPRVAVPTRDTGAVDPGIVRDQQRHRVALLVPPTGPNAAVGRSLANATQLALLDTRSEVVRITTYDTAMGASAAASRAVADGAQLILGPLLADDVRAVAPVARAASVPVVSFSNDAGVAGQGVYLLGYAPTQSIDRVVAFARTRGVTNFAGLMPNGLYGQRASTAFLRTVESDGGKVLSLQVYDRATGGVAAAVTRLAKSAPFDGVLIADSAATAAAAGPLVHRSSPTGHLLGTELWNTDPALATRAGLNGAWFASVSNGLYRQYVTKYRARFGTGPYRLSSLGYDSVLLVVRIARDWPIGAAFPEARLRDRGGYTGLDGAFRFGRDGIAERALEVQEIRGGAISVVSPAPGGFDGR
jgi:ABC-type branched-subunit amino acid transport system substrate-binding protein